MIAVIISEFNKINGDIKSDKIETHQNSNIKGNIESKSVSLGGKIKGNVSSDQIKINKLINKKDLI